MRRIGVPPRRLVEPLFVALLASVGAAWALGAPAPGAIVGTLQTDKFGAMYLHHQAHRAFAEGGLPLIDRHQLFPIGAPLGITNGANVLEMGVSWALRAVLDWPAWFNVAHVAWLPLNAVAFLVLARELWPETRDAALRVAAALTWAFQPVFLGEIDAGRLTQVALVGLPLAVAGLDRASRRPLSRAELVYAASGLALTGLGYWYYAIFLAICAPVWAAWAPRQVLPRFAAIGALALLLVSPALVGVAWSGWIYDVRPSLPGPPGGRSPLFDNALQLARAQPPQLVGFWVWALTPGLLLAVTQRAAWRWLALGAVCVTFALGPAQAIGGYGWRLPYYPLWLAVPTLDRLTHPSRWYDLGVIFVVVASFVGLRESRLLGGRAAWAAPLVALGLGAQLAARGPLPSEVPPRSSLWEAVARGSGALVVLPLLHAPDAVRWQALHGRPVIGGMVEGVPPFWPERFVAWVDRSPLLLGFVALASAGTPPAVRQGDVDALLEAGFTEVVLDAPSWRRFSRVPLERALAGLTDGLGRPTHQDADGALWALPTAAPPGHAAPPPGVTARPPR